MGNVCSEQRRAVVVQQHESSGSYGRFCRSSSIYSAVFTGRFHSWVASSQCIFMSGDKPILEVCRQQIILTPVDMGPFQVL